MNKLNLKNKFLIKRIDVYFLTLVSLITGIYLILDLFVFKNFFYRFSVAGSYILNIDTHLYATVGKGIAHGLRPYVDLYENKPPIFFYLFAISYSMFGNYYLLNVLSLLSMIFITLVPLVALIIYFIKGKHKRILLLISLALIILPFSTQLALFTYDRGLATQSEVYASTLTIIYFLIIYYTNANKAKLYSPSVIVSGILLMLIALTRETVLLTAIIGGIFLSKHKKDFIYKLALPLIYGGGLALLVLAATNTLVPYFSIYLKMIILYNNSKNSSIPFFARPFRIDSFAKSIYFEYSICLFIEIVLLFIYTIYATYKINYETYNSLIKTIIITSLKALLLIFGSTFLVGMTGDLWDHHFITPVALYVLMLLMLTLDLASIIFTEDNDRKYKNLVSFKKITYIIPSCALLCIASIGICTYSLNRGFYECTTSIESQEPHIKFANYLDEILDNLNESRYFYLCNEEEECYNYFTRHDCLGPAFWNNGTGQFNNRNTYFATSVIEELKSANVVVGRIDNPLDTFKVFGAASVDLQTYFDDNFIPTKPISIRSIEAPENLPFDHKIYFRRTTFIFN